MHAHAVVVQQAGMHEHGRPMASLMRASEPVVLDETTSDRYDATAELQQHETCWAAYDREQAGP
jgi:hypothetical protein